jgi:predicted enzyme related to lactoylglutathione lyase
MDARLRNVTFDAPDHRELARFYSALLAAESLRETDEWTVIKTSDGWRLGFQPAVDHVRPAWPSQDLPQQLHLDFQVQDIAAAAARAESLGASRTRGGDGEKFVVLTDPAGHPFCLCAGGAAGQVAVFGVCLDCSDPVALSRFYAGLLGLPSRYEGADGAWLGGDGPMATMTFQAVAGYNAPRWPDPAFPQQVHLDVWADDLDDVQRRVLRLGGRSMPGAGDNWRVFADPAGHPFCLVFEEPA